MAPRADRRPGFSRRRQYGLFFAQVIAIAGALFGILLVLIARFDPQGFAGLRGLMLDATTPVAAALRGAVRGSADAGQSVADYIAAGRQNAELRGELAHARRAIVSARAAQLENGRLKAMLRLVEPRHDQVAVARLVGSFTSGTRRYATLTAGSADGVRPGQPVLAPEGLVGRVLEVGVHAARIMLLTDEGNVVPLRLARNGMPALATGSGEGALDVKPLQAGAPPFRRGDLLLTSGAGGIYPPGVPVAVVTAANRDGASAWPLADPNRLDFGVVEPVYQADPPRAPAPAPAVDR